MEKLTGLVRRCVEDYNMISEGDRVAVGISGGKDSLALLCSLHSLQRYYPKRFELSAVTADAGFDNMDFSAVRELCKRLQIPYIYVKTNIKHVVFDKRSEKNPCALCAKMRRGILCDTLNDAGISKIALGHHRVDAVETFLLSLAYEGRLNCFFPVSFLDRSGITQIRPLLYLGENDIRRVVDKYNLPVVESTCPENGVSKRQDAKELIAQLQEKFPGIEDRLFGALKRSLWQKIQQN